MAGFHKMYGSAFPNSERNANDHYPTPPWATYALVENEKTHLDRHLSVTGSFVHEPAAGRGWMAEELARCGYPVVATDLYDYEETRWRVKSGVDFLGDGCAELVVSPSVIITNPPYKNDLAEKFAKTAVLRAPYVAMLCRLTWAESKRRYTFFRDNPPSKILFFSQRFSCDEQYFSDEKSEGVMVAYAWWVWDKNRSGTAVDWVPPGGFNRWKESCRA